MKGERCIVYCHVVERDVSCSTNISGQRYAVEPSDFLEVTCNVEYRGNWMPAISCTPEIQSSLFENISTPTHVTYRRVIAAADIEDLTVIRCTTGFILLEWKDESALRTTPHPDVPEYHHVWTTQPIRIVPNITGLDFVYYFDFRSTVE